MSLNTIDTTLAMLRLGISTRTELVNRLRDKGVRFDDLAQLLSEDVVIMKAAAAELVDARRELAARGAP